MNSFFKFFLLFTLSIFTAPIFAGDGSDITIQVDDAATVHEDSGTMSFEIKLDDTPDWCTDVTVNYRTINGSAEAGSDYTQKSGSVVFRGACGIPLFGENTKTVTVNIENTPGNYEPTESLYLEISNSTTGYKVIRDRAEGVILDNNPPPLELTLLHDRSENERDNNWTLNFTARLNHPAPAGGVTVHYTTEDNTAIAGNDYISTTNSVVIPENSTDGIIPVTIIGDTLPEPTINENFKVKITSISQGTVIRDTATGTIKDDDRIKVDISSSDITEGNSGDSNKMEFKIFLAKDYPNIAPLTINYTTQDGSSPSATINDYTPTNGSVTFNAGDREKIIYVPIIGDDTIEPDENLKMFISGSDLIIDDSSESEIINDDGDYPGVDFSTGDLSIIEGNSSSKILNFTFTLDADALADSSFEYYTQDDEATVADNDYVQVNTKIYNITEGTRNITIPITINGDTKIEEDESFYIKFINEKNIVIHGHTAKAHIINDDGSYPNLSFDSNSFSITEGDVGQIDLNFTLTLDAPAFEGSSFDYYTENNTAELEDSDYEKINRKTYHLTAGERNIVIPVKINGDKNIEGDESFYLKIDNEINMTISGTQSPKGIINNDDGDLPSFSIEAPIVEGTEGNSGIKHVQFTIKLDKNVTEDGVSIQYRTVDGTAKAQDNDYQEITINTVLFAIGENNKTFYVDLFGDTKVEDNETFSIEILNPHQATISENQVEITIINDDLHNSEPFECKDNDMYISSSTNRETGATGKMWLHRIDTMKNPFEFQVLEPNGASEIYNATAYNPDDNYIYGLYFRDLIQLSKTGKVINLGKITSLPSRFENKQLYAGAIYDGFYYVAGRRNKQTNLFKINLADKTVSTITLSLAVVLKDFAFSPDGKYLYGIEKNGKLTRIEVSNGNTIQIGENHNGYIFDSTFSDKNGRLFANDGEGSGFFEFNIETGTKQFLSNSQPASYNDGANCLNASLLFTDYGDAPESYGMVRHDIRNGIFMGSEVDHDITPYYSPNADGDDNHGIDDDDGVTFIDGADINNSYFETNQTQELNITVSKDGFLNVWLDFGIDGTFTTAGDKVISSMPLTAGTHTINFFIPATVPTNQLTYIRFRYSSSANLTPTQSALDGEVEDYAIKFGSVYNPLKGIFNIERIDSADYPINSNSRDAWYTQIVGRDFDYSILFYKEDLSEQQEISKITVKLELVNMETNTTLYERYAYIQGEPPISRINITLPLDDLTTLPATRDARFRISYGVNEQGDLLQIECNTAPKTCYDNLPLIHTDYARDNFAIRPETFYVTIKDKNNNTLRNSRDINQNHTPIRLASGYDYNLTVTATQYREDNSVIASPDYNTTIDRWLRFKGALTCNHGDDNRTDEKFSDGNNTTHLFQLQEVGAYRLKLEDSNWTYVDQNQSQPELSDCLLGNNIYNNIPNAKGKVGCNITQQSSDINISFQPYKFKINLAMEEDNIPNSSHPDFLYMMSGIDSTNNDVAIQFEGEITAQSEDDINLTNFTSGCVANDINLSIDITTLSEDGNNTIIRTAPSNTGAREDINFTRVIQYNKNTTHNQVDINNSLVYANSNLIIKSDKFLDENNGTTYLQIRYNLNKSSSKTINPVQLTFHSFDVNSTNSFSETNTTALHYPLGEKDLGDTIRNFYFAQIAPDSIIYPMVNCITNSIIDTPVNVDIFCDKNLTYCRQTGVMGHTKLLSSPRASGGFYSSIDHNQTVDGSILNLIHSSNLRTNPNPDTSNPLEFTQGRNGLLTTKFRVETKEKVSIVPTDALLYNPNPSKHGQPEYEVSCRNDYNSSQWTGLGKTGNVLNINANIKKTYKMDW